jgi:sialate O-acetylesterase
MTPSRFIRQAGLSLMVMAVAWSTPHAGAEVALHPLFTEGLVLQRQAEVPVWGWAAPGETVTVEFAGQKKAATTDATGNWLVKLDPMPASAESRELVVRSGTGNPESKIAGVLVGEVWLCSGQSNMDVPVSDTPMREQVQAAPGLPMVRMATVGWAPSAEPVKRPDPGRFLHDRIWRTATPEQVQKMSAVAYAFGRELNRKLNIPVGLIVSSKGGTPAETWMPREVLLADPELAWTADPKLSHPEYTAPGLLYNGMIRPLQPFRLRGAVWYQGEDNISRGWTYRKTLPALIACWRKEWGAARPGDFPFGIVQLAGMGTAMPILGNDAWSELRESQAVVARQPGNGLAVALDTSIDDPDIHPNKRKEEVGKRLAYWALNQVYQKADVEFSGPLYASHKIEGKTIRVSFEPLGGGLTAKGGKPTYFIIAGEDRQFKWADAVFDGDTIVVSSPQVPKPAAVRYAWSNGPSTANKSQVMNVYGRNGLPLAPFRTDAWKLETAPEVVFPATVLPVATVGRSYAQALTTAAARGGPITYAVAPGAQLPAGLALDAKGRISGTPSAAGTFTITVRAMADSGATRDAPVIMTVLPRGAPPTWTVAYDANGATRGKAPAHQAYNGRTPLPIPANPGDTKLERPGFIFGGWNTAPDGTGETYAEGASYTTKADAVLFAKWVPIQVEYRDQTLPPAVVGQPYNATAANARAGEAHLVYERMAGKLANGLDFNFPFGTVTGTPTETGTFSIVVKAKTNDGQSKEAKVTVTVAPSR